MQNKTKSFIFILLSLIIFPLSYARSQDLQAEVLINTDNLPSDAKDRLSSFVQQVQDYLNRNKFSQKDIPPIKCSFQFTFRTASGIDAYDAQLFVASQREVYRQNKQAEVQYSSTFRFLDDRVSFNYNKSMQFIKNDVIFDSFLSLLNYYAYMIVGYDEDSYYPVGGTSYFQKAIDICNKPMSDRSGWTETGGGSKPSRLQLVQELMSAKFENFRKGYFEYHWMGLDSIGIIKANGLKNILLGLQKIYNVRKNEVRAFNIDMFFDEKADEIGRTFLNYGDRNIYNTFIQYDPAHQRTYEDFKKQAH